jgi:hypothetical protein
VVGVPGRIVRNGMRTETDLNHGTLPDPVVQAIQDLRQGITSLENRLDAVEAKAGKREPARNPGRQKKRKQSKGG